MWDILCWHHGRPRQSRVALRENKADSFSRFPQDPPNAPLRRARPTPHGSEAERDHDRTVGRCFRTGRRPTNSFPGWRGKSSSPKRGSVRPSTARSRRREARCSTGGHEWWRRWWRIEVRVRATATCTGFPLWAPLSWFLVSAAEPLSALGEATPDWSRIATTSSPVARTGHML